MGHGFSAKFQCELSNLLIGGSPRELWGRASRIDRRLAYDEEMPVVKRQALAGVAAEIRKVARGEEVAAARRVVALKMKDAAEINRAERMAGRKAAASERLLREEDLRMSWGVRNPRELSAELLPLEGYVRDAPEPSEVEMLGLTREQSFALDAAIEAQEGRHWKALPPHYFLPRRRM